MSHTDQVKLEGVTEATSPILSQAYCCGDVYYNLDLDVLQDPSSTSTGENIVALFPDDIARLKAILASVEV